MKRNIHSVIAFISVMSGLVCILPLSILVSSGKILNTTNYRTITSTTYGMPTNQASEEGRVGDFLSLGQSSGSWRFVLPEFLSEDLSDDTILNVDAYLFLEDNTPLSSLDAFEGSLFGVTRIVNDDSSSVYLHNSVYGTGGTNMSVAWYDVALSEDLDKTKYSYVLYLDNDLEENAPTMLYDDDGSFWKPYQSGKGDYGVILSDETTKVIRGQSSQEVKISSGSYADLGVYHQFIPPQDWSSHEFLGLWICGPTAKETLHISIGDTDDDSIGWVLTGNWSGWKRLVLPLNSPDEQTGAFEITNVKKLEIRFREVDSNFAWYLDRVCLDVGQWVKVEAFVPDSITDYKLYSWDVGTDMWITPQFAWWGMINDIDSGRLKFLSGHTVKDMYSAAQFGESIYPPAQQGEMKSATLGNGGLITYSTHCSRFKRVGYAVKMPPDDDQDTSGSGISQCKLKFEVYYENADDTVHDIFPLDTIDMPNIMVSMNNHSILNTTLKARLGNYLGLSHEEYEMNTMLGSIGPSLRILVKPDYLDVENTLNIVVDHHTSWDISFVMLRLIDSTRQLHIPFTQTLGTYSLLAFIVAYSPLICIILAAIIYTRSPTKRQLPRT